MVYAHIAIESIRISEVDDSALRSCASLLPKCVCSLLGFGSFFEHLDLISERLGLVSGVPWHGFGVTECFGARHHVCGMI
jgi:hypothetical protein